MDIKRAKQEIKDSVEAYLNKNEYGEYRIPALRQRPVLLMGPPGIGKTQIMEQIAKECGIGLVAYTITHHTRQSAVGLPFIKEKTYGGVSYSVTEYMKKWNRPAFGRVSYSSMRSTVSLRHLRRRCCSFYSARPLEIRKCRRDGSSWQPAILRSTISLSVSLMW